MYKFLFKKANNGTFKYKAVLKKDGTLKKEYKDYPRFDIIYDYENKFKNDFDDILKTATKEIILKVKSYAKTKTGIEYQTA